MTWYETKLISLQKMFAISGSTISSDEATTDYLAAMPAAANEALVLLCTVCRPLVKSITIEKNAGSQARFDLKALAPDLFSLTGRELLVSDGSGTVPYAKGRLEGERFLVLPAEADGIFTVYYNAYPPAVTGRTADDWELPVDPDAAALVPLYIASQVYRDDDITIATACRNEFEAGIFRLTAGLGRAGYEQFTSEGGWSA